MSSHVLHVLHYVILSPKSCLTPGCKSENASNLEVRNPKPKAINFKPRTRRPKSKTPTVLTRRTFNFAGLRQRQRCSCSVHWSLRLRWRASLAWFMGSIIGQYHEISTGFVACMANLGPGGSSHFGFGA